MHTNKIIGVTATVIFHLLLLLLLFYWGFEIPYPPPAEQGILISFGNSPTGSGHTDVAWQQQPHIPQPPQQAQPQEAPKIQEENITQDYEDAPSIKPEKKKKKPKPEREPTTPTPETPVNTPQPEVLPPVKEEPKPVEKPRQANPNALFPGSGSAGSGSGSGTEDGTGSGSTGGSGDQGTPDGSPHSPHAVGTPFGSPHGVSLDGRSVRGKLPDPAYSIQQSGKVIVRIRVDRDGNVVEAEAQQTGSTLINATLYKAAEEAARKAKFSVSSTAPVYQWGTITYVFKLN